MFSYHQVSKLKSIGSGFGIPQGQEAGEHRMAVVGRSQRQDDERLLPLGICLFVQSVDPNLVRSGVKCVYNLPFFDIVLVLSLMHFEFGTHVGTCSYKANGF